MVTFPIAMRMKTYNGFRGTTAWQTCEKINSYKGRFAVIFCGVSESTTHGRILLKRKTDNKVATIEVTKPHSPGDGKIVVLNITEPSEITIQGYDNSPSFAWYMYAYVLDYQ